MRRSNGFFSALPAWLGGGKIAALRLILRFTHHQRGVPSGINSRRQAAVSLADGTTRLRLHLVFQQRRFAAWHVSIVQR